MPSASLLPSPPARPEPARHDRGRRRIAVVFPGDPSAKGTWSGTPSGILAGLEAAGVRGRALNATAPAWLDRPLMGAVALAELPHASVQGLGAKLRQSLRIARNTPAMSRSYTWGARRALARARESQAVVQIGAGYMLSCAVPHITFEDMTIRQALACGYPEFCAMSPRQRARRIDLQRQVYERATVCAVATPWAAHSVIDDYGIAPEKVHVVWIGANHRLASPPARDWARPRFLFVGRDWEGKNGRMVVRTFERLRTELPDARLEIVGRHPPLDAPGVTGHGLLRLDHPSERARIEDLYRGATCVVMPSHREAAGIAYAEAMHAGLPCIGTSVGGAGDVIGDAGRTVDPADEHELFEAMAALADPEVASALGAAARVRSSMFTWEAVGERLLTALDTARR